LKKGKPATNARQEKALGFRQPSGGELRSQFQDAVYQSKAFGVEGHKAFGVHLSEGHMQCPLFGSDVTHTVQCQVDAFSDTDTSDSHQEQRIGVQIVGTTQFLLQPLVVFRRQRPGKVFGTNREVFADDETRLDGMALGGQVVEQTAKAEETLLASVVANRRAQFAKPAKPTQHMGIAAELGKSADLRERGPQIADEVAGHIVILDHGEGL
jgi:hypothetical protein